MFENYLANKLSRKWCCGCCLLCELHITLLLLITSFIHASFLGFFQKLPHNIEPNVSKLSNTLFIPMGAYFAG